jgi:hypothetical protein
MYKIQRLTSIRPAQAVAARRGSIGRVWVNVAKPKRRRAVAEAIARFARIDDPNALIRVAR